MNEVINSRKTADPIILNELIEKVKAKGIDAGKQSTFFEDQVYAHIYGFNRPALILTEIQFVSWAPAFLEILDKEEEQTEDEPEEGEPGFYNE